MPSVRVKRSRLFYSSLSDDAPETPAHPPARQRARSVVEIFPSPGPRTSGDPNLLNVPSQTRRPRANTYAQSGTRRISRVSQHIMNNNGTWRSQDTPLLEHRRSDFSMGKVARNSSPLRNQDSGNYTSEQGRVDDANSVTAGVQDELEDHEEDVVDHLDVIDPQVSTVSNLTNAANSIILPPFSFHFWKPAVVLPVLQRQSHASLAEKGQPSAEFPENELDRHVEDVLRRRDKFRRTLKGVGSFLKTPLGVIAAIYFFCVVFWGAAIIFFLAKFINLHNADKQGYWVEVSSQVVNALFTATGVGLVPLRVVDTYRMSKICHYQRKTRKLRAKAGLPALLDKDDLPDPIYDPNHVHVLTDDEQRDLHYQQVQFMKSQTWYRPHGNSTHTAFPINTALLICCLIDWNSIFQIVLCGTMWGLNRFQRPAWSTGILIPASFLCQIFSGVFIWRGGQKTKRTAVVEERLRTALSINTTSLDPITTTTQGALTTHRGSVLGEACSHDSLQQSVVVDEHVTVPKNV